MASKPRHPLAKSPRQDHSGDRVSRHQGRERAKALALAKHMQGTVPGTEGQLTVTQASPQQKDNSKHFCA